ncbi:PA0069 family radical SAM protein [Ramlibacter sp. USB13]|uniref:PA0069 family radical SAM protein n=1 Tax=Ramlibacter cellulosilyticus TaxID=2764187 RepID=A0A923MV02_9BURK|nr:PA0069 family radical SAM protein [Ramlibacter cellulosilyticus]MBC5785670.1 PA0069 family radical SAM protein [Ramlibacter cellulosilyticus]
MDSIDRSTDTTATEVRVPLAALKGRGTSTWFPHRFEKDAREVFDDGWDHAEDDAAGPRTEVTWETAKSIIASNDSPDIYFDKSINPYRGCEHGCIYCYARPTHSYLNLSPGLDFETKIIAKRNTVDLLRAEMARRSYRPEMIAIGTATDCYQPVERELRLTRGVIEVMHETNHPFGLVTKSSGVERDLDLIVPMARKGLAAVYVTITTLDADLARKLEPRAAAPHRRLRVLRTLAEAGVPCGVSLAPQIPFLNDDMEQVLEAAWDAGAREAFYHVIRLPWEVAPLFRQWLEVHYPQRAQRVMHRIQEMRGGKDYDSDFATRMKGSGTWAQLIRQRFDKTARRLGFNAKKIDFRTDLFRPPAPAGQGTLF